MDGLDEYRSLYDLGGKVALVPGGAGGIGRAVSEALAAFGATVIVCGRTAAKAESLAAEITAAGGRAAAAELDITRIDGMRRFVEKAAERYGRLDILVNCVGTHIEVPAIECGEEQWDHVVDVDLKFPFFLSQAVARVQIPQGGGKQVHISSVRSLLGIHRGYAPYCSAKGGLNLMIRQLASEWARYNITVNGIAPTFTRTDAVRRYLEDPDFYGRLVARIPLGRVCEPSDVAALAVYLAAPASSFVTGQIIFVDGGLTAVQ